MSNDYNVATIEVLSSLKLDRKRLGMHTTTHPSHLVPEMADNSADQAIAGNVNLIEFVFFKDRQVTTRRGVECPPFDRQFVSRGHGQHVPTLPGFTGHILHSVEYAYMRLMRWRGIAITYAKKTASFLVALQIRCIVIGAAIL
jgi:hypothetical protein